ncbi:MAG: histidine--tRNA ligase [Bacilli bacterium]|nr:histidine--tRNA ligase [Bacilli bacterium]
MEEIKNVKGTHDVFGDENNAYEKVESLMKSIAEIYAYKGVRPPVLEYNSVFVRGVGESSDVVRKEMYTFADKGGRDLTLRPEFTAGIMRLAIQNKLYATNELPLKLYYLGPVFRYERPQLGRYRQFNQFGVESIGHNSPMNDVEVIVLAYTILSSLGLENVKIKINTLGDEASRNAYRAALKEYFAKYIDNMCVDCKSRFELNPLRILDCKVPDDRPIIDEAPKIGAYLSKESKERFDAVLEALESLQIPYEIDQGLVRGLDYYSETVFEFHYKSAKGNDYGAIGAGGHYGSLMKELGGPDLPGVGFSFGIERVVSVLSDNDLLNDIAYELDAYIMPLDKSLDLYAQEVAVILRNSGGYKVDVCFDNVKLGNMFKRATTKNAKYAIIIGEDEAKAESVVLKDLATQEQQTVKIEDLVDKLDELYESSYPEEEDK